MIPTNFVIFTTCSIVGSSVLYHDLTRTSPVALLGVICMFLGVVMITTRTAAETYIPIANDRDASLPQPIPRSPILRLLSSSLPIPVRSIPLPSPSRRPRTPRRASVDVEFGRLGILVGSVGALRQIEFECLADVGREEI